MATVYLHTNKINGKKYVGMTKKHYLIRWGENGENYKSNKIFYDDILKYGWKEGFDHDVIETNISLGRAAFLEVEFIREFETVSKGYNNTDVCYGGLNENEIIEVVELMKEKNNSIVQLMKNGFSFENPMLTLINFSKRLNDIKRLEKKIKKIN